LVTEISEERRERKRDAARKWQLNNPEKVRLQKRRWYKNRKNPEKDLAARRQYYKNNSEKVLTTQRQDYIDNPEKFRIRMSQWKRRNRAKVNETARRYLQNPLNRLLARHRCRVAAALKRVACWRRGRTVDLLGCSIDFYKDYLEKLFVPGMSWANRNLWHIDHITAVSKFDLSTEQGQKAAFRYTNTQPLWASDNLRKGAR
jgi:hypothetical protein